MDSNNLKNHSDEDIIALVEGFEKGEIAYHLNDLKVALSEVTNRKMEQRYIDMLAEKIKTVLEEQAAVEPPARRQPVAPSSVEQPIEPAFVPPVQEETKPIPVVSKQPEYEEELYEADAEERYPILSFLSSLYRVFGWIMLVGWLIGGGILCLQRFLNDTVIMVGIMLGAATMGIIFVLGFYAASESILLRLDIERHLAQLRSKE